MTLCIVRVPAIGPSQCGVATPARRLQMPAMPTARAFSRDGVGRNVARLLAGSSLSLATLSMQPVPPSYAAAWTCAVPPKARAISAANSAFCLIGTLCFGPSETSPSRSGQSFRRARKLQFHRSPNRRARSASNSTPSTDVRSRAARRRAPGSRAPSCPSIASANAARRVVNPGA